jgi:hypothetical protein
LKSVTEEDGEEEAPEDFPGVDELVGSFMNETSLWPVLLVAIASAGALGAAMLILTVVDRNPFAAAALLLVFGMSVDLFIQGRRKLAYRNIARLVGLIWCAAVAFAGVAIWTGIAF